MSEWQDFHDRVQSAVVEPLKADCKQLCRVMEQCLAVTPEEDRLRVGGSAIALIAEVLFLKMQEHQQTIVLEEDSEPELEDYEGFPILDEEDDHWERHTMSLDLDSDEEDWEKTKKPKSRSKSGSTAAPVSQQKILDMLKKLAGDEDPTAWSGAIAQWLKEQPRFRPVPVEQLQHAIYIEVAEPEKALRELSIVELWMGLLLGGFTLEQRQDPEAEFYRDLTKADIWIIEIPEQFGKPK
ncbi:MAG: hypothetical protein MUC48_09465 [Leptolyngbya sp. Prado105]|jgi:hypothetical protein|nr:hypothetical protein [Leptolyngbya sp. Prado105]